MRPSSRGWGAPWVASFPDYRIVPFADFSEITSGGAVACVPLVLLAVALKRHVESDRSFRNGEIVCAILVRATGVLSPLLRGDGAAKDYIMDLGYGGRGKAAERQRVWNLFNLNQNACVLTNKKGYSICFEGAFAVIGHIKGSTREPTV